MYGIFKAGELTIDVYDEHALHITEHTRFLLSAEFKRCKNKEQVKERFITHIDAHKAAMKKEV